MVWFPRLRGDVTAAVDVAMLMFANAVTGFTRGGDRSASFSCRRDSSELLLQEKRPHCCSSCLTQYSFFMFVLFFFLTGIKLNAERNCQWVFYSAGSGSHQRHLLEVKRLLLQNGYSMNIHEENNIFTIQMRIKYILNGEQNTDCSVFDWPLPEDIQP